jgi:L-ornithine N5-monooxygenase
MVASPPAERDTRPVHDIVAVGCGPSNLALATAVHEHNSKAAASERLSLRILERKPEFGWHRGMLLDGTTMQVSFLKDLVTMRNPVSPYSFLNYLHQRSRMVDFINHRTLFPSRAEFHDYLEWVAAQFADVLDLGVEVVDVRPVLDGDLVTGLDVVGRPLDARRPATMHRARNLVIGTGVVPAMPAGVERTDRVCHSAELLDRLAGWGGAGRFAVVGAGQSAAEVAAHLHSRFPTAEVLAIFSRYGYSPADDSPFANRVFDPAAVDEFFLAPEAVKEKFYAYHGNTNYSAVDQELIAELYRRMYEERVRGVRRLQVRHLSRVVDVVAGPETVRLRVEALADGRSSEVVVDAAVFATGYRPMDPAAVLGEATQLCKRDHAGRFRVERDYRVTTSENVHSGIFVQGGTEHTHGLTSSLLSNTAIRAGEIVAAVLGKGGGDVRS